MKFVVFSQKSCAPCDMAKKILDRYKADYEVRDIELPENQAQAYELAGMNIVPVILTDNETIVGFQPQRLIALCKGTDLDVSIPQPLSA